MNTLARFITRKLARKQRQPVYEQLELPLAGTRLNKEQWEIILELQRWRREMEAKLGMPAGQSQRGLL